MRVNRLKHCEGIRGASVTGNRLQLLPRFSFTIAMVSLRFPITMPRPSVLPWIGAPTDSKLVRMTMEIASSASQSVQ